MNNELQKTLVATHNDTDRELAIRAAFELVRALINTSKRTNPNIWHLNDSLGFPQAHTVGLAAMNIANLITLPEQQPQTGKLTTGDSLTQCAASVLTQLQFLADDCGPIKSELAPIIAQLQDELFSVKPQTDNRVVWRGEMPEPLPFSEPINGVEQDG